MIRPGAVQCLARQAEKAKKPGLYGIFGVTDLECADLWRYLENHAEHCDDVILNTPQREVAFSNGSRVRVFCSSWRTYIGLRFDAVLFSDESIRGHVASQVKLPEPEPDEPPPAPVFGL